MSRPASRRFLTRIRQNHALEHATMHLLTRSRPSLRLIGRSDWKGFWLYGEVETGAVRRAASEALVRLRRDETWLAVHPRCGTNLAIAALLTGGASYVAASVWGKSRFKRLAGAIFAGMVGLVLSRPLGLATQRHITTSTDLDDVHLEVVPLRLGGNLTAHHVLVSLDDR